MPCPLACEQTLQNLPFAYVFMYSFQSFAGTNKLFLVALWFENLYFFNKRLVISPYTYHLR